MRNKILKNTFSLYAMNIAKLIIPLIILPYLTRVLTKDCYGIVSYVKAVMGYMQLIVDFGFMLSGTNDIIHAKSDKHKMECEIGDILAARLLLAGVAYAALVILMFAIPILKKIYCILFFPLLWWLLLVFFLIIFFAALRKCR